MSKYYDDALEFAKKYIAPYAEEMDAKAEFPKEVFKKLGEHGYMGLMVEEEYGGQGKGVQQNVEVCLAFAQYAPTVALCYMMHNNVMPKFYNASKEIKDKILPEIVKNGKFIAAAGSEPKGGNNSNSSETTYKVVGDKAIINGSKTLVTMGGNADYYSVVCTNEENNQVSWFIVPSDTPGITFDTNDWNGFGMRGNTSCSMYLKDVEVDLLYLIAHADTINKRDIQIGDNSFIMGIACANAGVTFGVCRNAIEHIKSRVYPDGKKMIDFDTIKLHVSKVYTLAQATKSLCLEAGRATDANEEDQDEKCVAARLMATEASMEAAKLGMRIGGGRAYNNKGSMTRWLRDSYAGQVMAPSVDALSLTLGKNITNKDIEIK
ncbi:acyl-CoA dehydrogenase family protein [Facklamia hominis]|uniref:Acyl-CoA dehydrogenase n=1 Tax=Facklamia hominis CCUG 36813 TaxID=883111 RepID=K1LV80_9LACT|nr:acyl-CoA dehydrogenase family protein [Facklamia hominis]EKB53953.1 hypothetical protein HMPREF9706_01389 [Facklamia hominis CCUG 36813]